MKNNSDNEFVTLSACSLQMFLNFLGFCILSALIVCLLFLSSSCSKHFRKNGHSDDASNSAELLHKFLKSG